MNPKINLMIIEPSDIIVEGLKSIISESSIFNILTPMNEINNIEEKIIVQNPNIILLNPTLLHPLERTRFISVIQNYPNIVLIGLVYQYIDPQQQQYFNGFIDIRESRNKIYSSIKKIYENSHAIEPNNDEYELSERETSVLILVAKGLSSKDIASKLNISIHTVNTHRKNITTKTGIKSVAGLAVYAMLHNLVEE